MCKEGLFLGFLCELLFRSASQDFDSFSLIPISRTILILQLLDFLLDVTKKTKRIDQFDITDFQNCC